MTAPVLGLAGAAAALDDAAAALGDELGVDGPVRLRERAQILGIAPRGDVSAGGSCRLLPTVDGRWAAVNLARRGDVALLAAWMEREWEGPVWDAVASALAQMEAEAAVARAQLLGIPAAVAAPPPPRVTAPRVVQGSASRGRTTPRVVDLSALWAGPLCAGLLGGLGATVVKVEGVTRPDGARRGPPEFWTRLNGGKDERVLDFERAEGRRALLALVDDADVVVTSARPRALEHLDLGLGPRVRAAGLVWVSITGYGMVGAWRDRVAFGDDAAVAGGLAVAAGGLDSPVFVGDAPADPLAGLHGAVEAARCLETGVGAFIDVSMQDVVGGALAGAITTEHYAAASVEVT